MRASATPDGPGGLSARARAKTLVQGSLKRHTGDLGEISTQSVEADLVAPDNLVDGVELL